jgi:hypothetical protein
MIRTTLFTLFFGLAGCSVHAHTPPQPPPPRPNPPAARHHAPHHAPNPKPVKVKAWVWVKGHQSRYGWVHGYWDLRTIPRHMINRQPHTHVRYVRGRGRPAPPARRYR